MPPAPPMFAKNALALARVLFPAAGERAERRLATSLIPTLTARADFPKKQPRGQGWLRAEVLAWQADLRKKNQWLWSEKGKELAPAPALEIPPRPEDQKQTEFLKLTPDELAAQRKRRMDYLEDIYLHPGERLAPSGSSFLRLTAREEDELREWRPHLFATAETKAGSPAPAAPVVDNDLCDTLTALAERMELHYRNPDGSSQLKYQLGKQEISDWRHGKRLPPGCPPPPAANGVKRQHSLRANIAWFDKYFADWKLESAQRELATGAVANIRELEDIDKREQIEFNRWERDKERGKYIAVDVAGRLAGGQMRQLADYWRNRNERDMIEASKAKLLALGVPAEAVIVHTDWLLAEHRRFTDEVESKASAAAEKYRDLVKQEVESTLTK